MLPYDNSGLYEYAEVSPGMGRLSDYVYSKINDKAQFRIQVLKNLQKQTMVAQSTLNHFRLAGKFFIQEVAGLIPPLLEIDKFSDNEKSKLVTIFHLLGGNMNQIEDLIIKSSTLNEWNRAGIDILVTTPSTRLIKYLLGILDDPIQDLKSQLLCADHLVKLNHEKGVEFIFKFLLETISIDLIGTDLKSQRIAANIAIHMPVQAIPQIETFLRAHYIKEIVPDQFRDRPIDVVFDIAQRIALQSLQKMEQIFQLFSNIATDLKPNHPGVKYLYTKAVSIQKFYYLNSPDNKTLEDTLIALSKLEK